MFTGVCYNYQQLYLLNMHDTVSKSFNPRLSNAFYFIRKGLYKKIKQYAPELQGKLMDFGCGSKPYQSLFTNAAEYIGVDFRLRA